MDLHSDRDHGGRGHSHHFGQDRRRPGEGRTVAVVLITSVTMVVEVAAGLLFGSMALLADGLHMGSHAVALGIAVFAYVYARRHARDPRFNFGTGKVNALGGFAGAVLLALFAVMMAWESVARLFSPVAIAFDKALLVACVGLVVNGVSVVILGNGDGGHHDGHGHAPHGVGHEEHRHDHNLRSAYFHVLADALTSVLAILALLSGMFLGWTWMDPLMGVVGAVLVAAWSGGLLVSASQVLLDMQAPEAVRSAVRQCLENDGETVVTDLHLWSIGPELRAAAITLVAKTPRTPEYYRNQIPDGFGVVHATIEVMDASPEAGRQ